MKSIVVAGFLALTAVHANAAACSTTFADGPLKIGQGLSRKGLKVPLWVAGITIINADGTVGETAIYTPHQFEDVYSAGLYADNVNKQCQETCSNACYAGVSEWVVTPGAN